MAALVSVSATAFTVDGEMVDTVQLYYEASRLGDGRLIHGANQLVAIMQNICAAVHQDAYIDDDTSDRVVRWHRDLQYILTTKQLPVR